MWSDILIHFRENNKQRLNFNIELHLVYYVYNILKSVIEFKIIKNKDKERIISIHLLTNDKNKSSNDKNKSLTNEKFFYWWQFDRYNEILKEEELIINQFNNLKMEITNTQNNLKHMEILDSDSEEKSNEKKIINEKYILESKKLQDYLRTESEKYKCRLHLLKQFMMIYPTIESLHIFLKSLKIILKCL